MVSLEQAREVVKRIIEESNKYSPGLGFHFAVYIYGSVAKNFVGNDADIIIEVPEEFFKDYSAACVVLLDGVTPFSDQLLIPGVFYDLYWDYFSPKKSRSEEALKAIGVNPDIINEEFPDVELDIVCLPEGWNDQNSDAYRDLMNWLALTVDPDFLLNAARSAVKF